MKNKSTWGGPRKGAGRPKGSTKDNNRIKISIRLPKDMVAWLRSKGLTATVERAVAKLREG